MIGLVVVQLGGGMSGKEARRRGTEKSRKM